MLDAMATPRKTAKSPAKGKAPSPDPARADGRVKSALTLAREAAALEAGRALLLKTLKANDWHLSATAEELGMTGAGQVIRAIRDHGLDAEYDAAKAAGKISQGRARP